MALVASASGFLRFFLANELAEAIEVDSLGQGILAQVVVAHERLRSQ